MEEEYEQRITELQSDLSGIESMFHNELRWRPSVVKMSVAPLI